MAKTVAERVHGAIEEASSHKFDGSIVIGVNISLEEGSEDGAMVSLFGDEEKLIFGLLRAMDRDSKFNVLLTKAVLLKEVLDRNDDK